MAHKKTFPANGRPYSAAYFIFIDASGHSRIVKASHRKKASDAFDLVQDTVEKRILRIAKKVKCETSYKWGWQGDGGLWLLHDDVDDERAHNAAMQACRAIVATDLPVLKACFRRKKLEEVRLRIAIHRGEFYGRGSKNRGLVHSEDINFAAHLEKVTPNDTLAISETVYEKLDKQQARQFISVGEHEEREVYLWSPRIKPNRMRKAWLHNVGTDGTARVHAYPGRPAPEGKAALVRAARKSFIDIGTTMKTCARSLTSQDGGEPEFLKEVLELLAVRKGVVRCYMLDPNGSVVRVFKPDPKKNTKKTAQDSFEMMKEFKGSREGQPGTFQFFTYDFNPGYAAMAVDIEEPDGLILFAPYLIPPKGAKTEARKEMPHYLISRKQDQKLYDRLKNHIQKLIDKLKPR